MARAQKKIAEMTRGEKVISFIEKYCKVPSGDHVGKPLVLEPFQRKFILDVYDNPYITRRALLSMARKNGKTALIAAIVLVHLVGPEAKQNTQIVSGAMARDQAALVFDLAKMMIEMDPRLSAVTKILSTKKIIGLRLNVEYKALAAEAKTQHGLSPVVAILDEIGQVKGPRDAFVSAITTAQGAYSQPLLFAISTQASADSDLFSLWLDAAKNGKDPRTVCHLYAADEDCDMSDPKQWAKANPALGVFKAREDLEAGASLAASMPANEPEFRQFSLNQRVEALSPFVTRSVWESNSAPPVSLDGRRVRGGLDLASVSDLCAFVTVDDEDGSVNSFFWLPEEGLKHKADQDKVPYDLWEKDGFLLTTPGKAVQYRHIAEFLRGVFDRCEVINLAFDRYLMQHLKPYLETAGFSDDEIGRFVDFGQGFQSMTPALRALEVKLLNAELKHGNHPVLNMCAANAQVVGDSGARKFAKPAGSRKIDGMVALAMAEGIRPVVSDDSQDFQVFTA